MPPPSLFANAVKSVESNNLRAGPSGPPLVSRISPAPGVGPASNAPLPRDRGQRPGNGIVVRGAAHGHQHPNQVVKPPYKKLKYEKNERVEIANRAADDFIAIYYANMDSSDRAEELSKMYRPNSTFIWNGNRIVGRDAIKEFLTKVPPCKHELQSYDCHAIPGTEGGGRKPSLLITVSGSVVHGLKAIENPAPRHMKVVDALPRLFSQTFVLSPDISEVKEELWKDVDTYIILSDHMRFVG